MNPLDWRGPEFLAFYLAYGVAVLLGLRVARRRAESGAGRVTLSDPYLIAYLRGGRNEALRVAVVSLVDRGLLEARGSELKAARGVSAGSVRRPIEKALLEHFAGAQAAATVFAAGAFDQAVAELDRALLSAGLLPREDERRARSGRFVLGLSFLLVPAALKIMVALARGRTNIWFLVILALVFAGVAAAVCFPRRTVRGDALLADLRALFGGLKSRAARLRGGGATAELALLAAVFGLGALPSAVLADMRALFPQAATTSGASCGASCGSSCGSSCGGGGCGGGCGGCGG